jgi:hypothetical protein
MAYWRDEFRTQIRSIDIQVYVTCYLKANLLANKLTVITIEGRILSLTPLIHAPFFGLNAIQRLQVLIAGPPGGVENCRTYFGPDAREEWY